MLADYTTGVLVQSHSAALRRQAATARHAGDALPQLQPTIAPERRTTPACCAA